MNKTIKIEYKVNGKLFSFDLTLTKDKDTPRSIEFACFKHYAAQTGENVVLPKYDDDYDIYTKSNIEIEIVFNEQFYILPSMRNYSKDEVKEMFA